ncbi:hypothetical protein WP1_088 [Pseudomonas phage WP1]
MTLRSLQERWNRIFEGFAAEIAPEFVSRADEAATAATLHGLSVAGVDQPVSFMDESVRNTLEAATTYSHGPYHQHSEGSPSENLHGP